MAEEKRSWEGKTGGGSFGQTFLLWALRTIPVKVFYPILFLVIPFYLLFGKQGRKAAYSYFRDRHGYSSLKAAWHTYINHFIFGQVVLDKFALLAGNTNQYTIDLSTSQEIVPFLTGEKGFIIAGAHIGNLDMAGLCIPHNEKRINSIIFGGESASLQKTRDKVFAQSNIRLIPVADDMSHLFLIKEALERGEIVVIPCDRILGSNKSVTSTFLGEEANFPLGTFRLAAQLEVPVLTLFIAKEGGTHHKAYSKELIAEGEYANSTQKAIALTHAYVESLDEYMRMYPDQWFNFFPFWNKQKNENK